MIDIQLIINNLPLLLQGALLTIQIAFAGCAIGITLGTILGIMYSGHHAFLRLIAATYTTLIRGTPMLIQIYFAFYALPAFGIQLPPVWAAIVAIGLNSAAYICNVIRAGIGSVGRGQIEAGKVLGLSNWQITRFIVLPQAFTVIFPALGNEFITLIKDSSLASMIGVAELTRQGSFIRSRTLDALTVYTAVALCYLILTSMLSLIMNYLEKRMKRHVTD